MSNENAAIQINFKTKKDGMLINLRASDVNELDLLIDGLTQRLATLIDLETTTESMAVVKTTFPGAEVVNQGAAPMPAHAQPAQQYQQPAPTAQGYAPAPAATPMCTCGGGPMRLVKAGISKSTGKPYRAFFSCPQPQGSQCNNRQNA